MATLTTSWQSVANYTFSLSGLTCKFYLEAKYSKQDKATNKTTVQTRLRSDVTYGSGSGTGYRFTLSYAGKPREGNGVWTFEDEVILTGENVITHNSDGNKSITLSASMKNNYLGLNKSISATVNLPKIDRLATVTSTSDFTDEENPTVSFNNPAGYTVKPYINFYDDNNNRVFQLYRDIEATSPYTWEITTEEREAMQNACNSQQSYEVTIGVDTFDGSTKLGYDSQIKRMRFVNAIPTYTYTLEELNENVRAVLGTTVNSIVENVSQIRLTVNPTALKGATIDKVLMGYGGLAYTLRNTYSNIFEIINSNTISFRVYDSRGFASETVTIDRNLINYSPVRILSYKFKRENPTSSNIILSTTINYSQVNFGETPNSITISYRNGANGELVDIDPTKYTINTENNTVSIVNEVLENLIPYNEQSTMYLYVGDLLSEDEENETVTKGIPTVEAGEHDFQVNGELYIADENRNIQHDVGSNLDYLLKEQTVLWQGAWFMNATQSANLSENISDQRNGIVLIFSQYTNGTVNDYDYSCHFVPKSLIELIPGRGFDFMLATSKFNLMSQKYLYINDDTIEGHENNAATGTATSGIKYTNNRFVLRYVIGV